MTLFIACLLIAGFSFPGWLYPTAVILWVGQAYCNMIAKHTTMERVVGEYAAKTAEIFRKQANGE